MQRFLDSLTCLWDSAIETGAEVWSSIFAWKWISCLRYLLPAKSKQIIHQAYACACLSHNTLDFWDFNRKILTAKSLFVFSLKYFLSSAEASLCAMAARPEECNSTGESKPCPPYHPERQIRELWLWETRRWNSLHVSWAGITGDRVMSSFSVVSNLAVKMPSEGFLFILSQRRFPIKCVQLASKHCLGSEQEGNSESENLFNLPLTVICNKISNVQA